jgi:hypothetical protein
MHFLLREDYFPLTLTLSPIGLILSHKFFCLVAQPFQAVRKSPHRLESLCRPLTAI